MPIALAPLNTEMRVVKILVDVDDEKEVHEYKLEDLEYIKKKQKKKNNNGKKNSQEDEEMKELEALEKIEKQEGKSKLGDN